MDRDCSAVVIITTGTDTKAEDGVADPRDKVGLLGKRNAEGVTTPPDEHAAKLVLLAKPDPQNQAENDAKSHIKRLQDVATDLAIARLNKIELNGGGGWLVVRVTPPRGRDLAQSVGARSR